MRLREAMRSFDLYACLLAGDETTQIEAKRADDVGKSLLQTISAFVTAPPLLDVAIPADKKVKRSPKDPKLPF